MNEQIKTWDKFFNLVKDKPYYRSLMSFLDDEYRNYIIYPPKELLFNAFNLTPLQQVKVVIIGQDPYHEPSQAMGLSFSVSKGVKVPPSLINIYKEIENEYHVVIDKTNGDLTYLAKQGVLLLNSILSVREHSPLSHNIKEYKELFMDILSLLDKTNQPIVFMLWGNEAKKLKKYLSNPNHLIIECIHPSPLSVIHGKWFNSGIFLRADEYLSSHFVKKITWYR